MTRSFLSSIRYIYRCGTIFFFLSFLGTIMTHRLPTLVNSFVPTYPHPHVQQQRLNYHHQFVLSEHRYTDGYGSFHRRMITQRPAVILTAASIGASALDDEGNGAGNLAEGVNDINAHYDTMAGGGRGGSINVDSTDVTADGKDNNDGITTSLLSELKEDAAIETVLEKLTQSNPSSSSSSPSSAPSSTFVKGEDEVTKEEHKKEPSLSADGKLDNEEDEDIDDEDSSRKEENIEPNINNIEYWKKVNITNSADGILMQDVSPPLTFQKYLNMQEKRVPINIRYTSKIPGLRAFYLTTAAKIKRRHPDVLIEKMILPPIEDGDSSTQQQGGVFEILVDGKVVVGKGRSSWQGVRRSAGSGGKGSGGVGVGDGQPVFGGMSVFVSMQEVDASIAKARRKRRPSTAYVRSGVEDANTTPAARLEILKSGRDGGMK